MAATTTVITTTSRPRKRQAPQPPVNANMYDVVADDEFITPQEQFSRTLNFDPDPIYENVDEFDQPLYSTIRGNGSGSDNTSGSPRLPPDNNTARNRRQANVQQNTSPTNVKWTDKTKAKFNDMLSRMNNHQYFFPTIAILIVGILVALMLFMNVSILVKLLCVVIFIAFFMMTCAQYKRV